MSPVICEYIWLDGYAKSSTDGIANLRSKIKILDISELNGVTVNNHAVLDPSKFPIWSFDGSSTKQAEGNKSDCLLKPCFVRVNTFDPYGVPAYFILCEVLNADETPHISNTRAQLVETSKQYSDQDMWFAFEQEYALFNSNGTWPYDWPRDGFHSPQGRYYCGVGSDVVFGRSIMMKHLWTCLHSNLLVSGTNAEVMPSQWEFQIGPGNAPEIADQLWMARYILNRVAEQEKITIKLSPKPVMGDWNGTGCHVNFSNKHMRDAMTPDDIEKIGDALRDNKEEHLKVYGSNNEKRLTGLHETCSINDFRIGESDRGASIRIPPGVTQKGRGYLEDRRPAANIDPYEVANIIMKTVCKLYA